jgi:hypothetical protein
MALVTYLRHKFQNCTGEKGFLTPNRVHPQILPAIDLAIIIVLRRSKERVPSASGEKTITK